MTFLLLYFFFRKDQWIVLLRNFNFRSLILISIILKKRIKSNSQYASNEHYHQIIKNDIARLIAKKVHHVTFNTNMFLLFNTSFYLSKLMAMNKKLTYRYAFTLLKMKHAEGRNEYIDLAQEANLLLHQILSQKTKNSIQIT